MKINAEGVSIIINDEILVEMENIFQMINKVSWSGVTIRSVNNITERDEINYTISEGDVVYDPNDPNDNNSNLINIYTDGQESNIIRSSKLSYDNNSDNISCHPKNTGSNGRTKSIITISYEQILESYGTE